MMAEFRRWLLLYAIGVLLGGCACGAVAGALASLMRAGP